MHFSQISPAQGSIQIPLYFAKQIVNFTEKFDFYLLNSWNMKLN